MSERRLNAAMLIILLTFLGLTIVLILALSWADGTVV